MTTTTAARAGSALAAWTRELARLVLPVACAGCDEPDVGWCTGCARLLADPWRCEHLAGRLDTLAGPAPPPVWATSRYVDEVRRAVVRWKDRGREDLSRPFAAALRRAGAGLAPALAATGTTALVVPVPSSAASRRARGTDPVAALAAGVVAGLRDAGVPAAAVPALRRRGGGRDQVGLGARARRANLAGAVVAGPGAARLRAAVARGQAPGLVVLVDDVLTTGATFASCTAAMTVLGLPVTAGLVLASTPPPRSSTPLRVPPRPAGTPPVRRVADRRGNGLAW